MTEGIMLPRMQEIFGLIGDVLKEEHLLKDIPAGLVITGGGAMTLQISEVAKRELNLPARIGTPTKLDGLVRDIHSPIYANSIGLLHYGLKHGQGDTVSNFSLGSLFSGFSSMGKFSEKISSLFKSLLP